MGLGLGLPSVGAGAAPPVYLAGSAKPSRLEPMGTAGPPTSSLAWVHGVAGLVPGVAGWVPGVAGWVREAAAGGEGGGGSGGRGRGRGARAGAELPSRRTGVVSSIRAEAALPPKKKAERTLKPRPPATRSLSPSARAVEAASNASYSRTS